MRHAHPYALRKAVQNLLFLPAPVQKADKNSRPVIAIRALLHNIADTGRRPACEYCLLLDQLIVSALDHIRLPLDPEHNIRSFIAEPDRTLTAHKSRRPLLKTCQFPLLLSSARLVFVQIFHNQLLDSFFVPVEAVRRRKDSILPAVAVVDLFDKDVLNPLKILLSGKLVKVFSHAVLHIDQHTHKSFRRIQGAPEYFIILLTIYAVCIQITVDRENALTLLTVTLIQQPGKKLHIHLTILRKCDHVAVQCLVIILLEPSPVFKMLQADRRHIGPGEKHALFVIIFRVPQNRSSSNLLIHNSPAFFLRQAQNRVGLFHGIIDRHEEGHVIFRIFTCK